MKTIFSRILLLSLLLSSSIIGSAQLADGSIAPDFTLSDIDGNTHTLSDYLNSGVPVILEFSATWCGPCWNYHQAGALESIWASHGFSATGDSSVMIFFIEADDNTGLAELQGGPGSQGDWTSVVNFPIIDAPAATPLAYNIAYFPTLYIVCQDGTLAEMGQISDIEYLDYIDNSCCAITGVNNGKINKVNDAEFCDDYVSEFSIKNLGSDTLSSASIEYSVDGVLIETISWTGSLAPFQSEDISTASFTSGVDMNIELTITSVNGTVDDDPSDNSETALISAAPFSSSQAFDLHIMTDSWPEEFSWEVTDETGVIFASGGGPGAYADLTLYVESIVLPTGGCYILKLNDTFGDGLSGGAYIELYDSFSQLLVNVTGDFSMLEKPFKINQTGYDIVTYPYLDMDADNMYTDGIDVILQNQFFTNTEGLTYYLESLTGLGHFFPDTTGMFEVSYNSDGTWISSPSSSTVVVDTSASVYELYFQLEAGTIHGDVIVDIVSGITRCFWEVPYWVTITNENTSTESGVFEVVLPDSVSYVSSVPPADSLVGNILYFSYDSLLPTYSTTYDLILQMPGVAMMGDDIIVSANTEEDSDSLSSELICSYDPNDKLVEPAGEGEEAFTAFTDSLLTYTIRFQNTGTDTAFNIVIRDTLSDLLDLSTFKYLSSSHTCQTSLDPNARLAEFSFDNILLPDSNVNQPGSNGYVKFQIEVVEGLDEGTAVKNTAGIYFDFNPAIITNTIVNTFATPPFSSETSVQELINPEFKIFPNPADQIINLIGDFNYQHLEIYSMSGNRVFRTNETTESINVETLPNGTYMIRLSDGRNTYTEKLVILR